MNQTLALRKLIADNEQTASTTINPHSSGAEVIEYSKLSAPCAILPGSVINFDATSNNTMSYPQSCLELVDSREWLRRYGLRTNKLNLESVLGSIGFKQSKKYVSQVNQIISSKYSKGLFLQTQTKDGYIYNITVNESKLRELAQRLEEAIKLFKLRLQWLNSDSRRLFGVITKKHVCLVIDCKNRDRNKFGQYKICFLRLIKEQVSHLASFNIIRCADKIEFFRDKSVLVSTKSIEEALEWMNDWTIDYKASAPADTITTEAVLQAFKDDTIEAVYLISEGTSSNGSRELLYDKLVRRSRERQVALNVVSFGCDDAETVEFLRRVATNSHGPGHFHAYCLLKHYDDYVRGSIDAAPTKTMVIANKRMLGGAPQVLVHSDTKLMYDEIQSARESLECVKAILDAMAANQSTGGLNSSIKSIEYATNTTPTKKLVSLEPSQINDDYITSAEWLKKYGLSARHLDLFEFLRQISFRHCDGVVDLMKEPGSGRLYFIRDGITYYQGDSIPCPKLVNAKYCDQFAHVLWNDGTIMHVHVTPDMNRTYEDQVKIVLDQIDTRIAWLSRGSRELFGTVIEPCICLLIDTSQSMQLSLEFVKRKLFALLQEQLRAKQRFNLIAFNTRVHPWRDRAAEVDEYSITSAFDWIGALSAQGTTNTLGALRFALADASVDAVYLLSDGRPDQDPREILSQIHLNTQIPIHTISFNCNDVEANTFLSDLAKETKGRYHYFNENGWNADPNGPVPYESEDISLLKKELEKGKTYLNQLISLREECARLKTSENKLSMRSRKSNLELTNRNKYGNNQGVLDMLNEIQSLEWILPETRELLLKKHYTNQTSSLREQKLFKSEHSFEVKPTTSTKKLTTKQIRAISNDSSLLKSHSKMKAWIEKNSLAALKLTMLDLLSISDKDSSSRSTGSTKKNPKEDEQPENVLVVDDLFEARVWNEILDVVGESSGIDRQRFKFINPSTVNLSEYEAKLEKQIQIYRKYLADYIWKALPDVEKSLLDNQAPAEFDDSNRDQLLKSLNYSNWPVKREDIRLVEEQIELAKKYIRLSRELAYYVQGKVESSRSKIDSVNRELDTIVESSPRESGSSKSNTTPRQKFLDEIDKQMSTPAKKEDYISRGDRVIARNDLLGYYFAGKVTKVVDSRHATVKFENGAKQEKMSFRNILKLNGPNPYITLGDYVMASVINEFEQKCWVPGIIQLIDTDSFPKLYTVLYFNGQEGENTRPEMIKINKNLYGFIVNYIRARLGLNTSVKANREDKKQTPPPPAPEKQERALSPGPEMDEIKNEIVDEIKTYFDSLKLDDKYQKMYDELLHLRKKQKVYKSDLEGKFKVLRKDFDEWRRQEPPTVLPDPNLFLYKNEAAEPIRSTATSTTINKQPEQENKQPPSVDEKVLKLRADLGELRPGEEVLAKWPDDGWYYRSIVKENLGNGKYQVEDSLKDVEQIYREDIISEINDTADTTFEEGDPVVALHPKYDFSYAPGQVVRVSSDTSKLLIKFYDYDEAVVVRNEVYKLPRLKYQLDVTNIVNLEKRWVGQTVVARNNYSNVYELGKIVNRIGNGRQYTIEWSNGKQSVQNANHIFGKYTRNQSILNNDYVLAPRETIFLPGRVLSQKGDQLRVKFVDEKIDENVSLDQMCFWLSRDYYEDACAFYRREATLDDKRKLNNDDDDDDEDSSDDVIAAKTKKRVGRKTPVIDANEFKQQRDKKKEDRSLTPATKSTNKKKPRSRVDSDDSDIYEAD